MQFAEFTKPKSPKLSVAIQIPPSYVCHRRSISNELTKYFVAFVPSAAIPREKGGRKEGRRGEGKVHDLLRHDAGGDRRDGPEQCRETTDPRTSRVPYSLALSSLPSFSLFSSPLLPLSVFLPFSRSPYALSAPLRGPRSALSYLRPPGPLFSLRLVTAGLTGGEIEMSLNCNEKDEAASNV